MTDMPNLDDQTLREMAARAPHDEHALFKEQGRRQRDAILATIRDRQPVAPVIGDHVAFGQGEVARIERELGEAEVAHRKAFSPDTARTAQVAAAIRQSESRIAALREELDTARRDLSNFENAARDRELRAAQLADPAISRTFQFTAADGRKGSIRAVDLATAKRMLQPDFEITGEIFAGGYAVPLQGPSLFDGFIQAHGEQLVSYFAERGFVIRRDQAA